MSDSKIPRIMATDASGMTKVLSLAEYYSLAGVSPAASAAYDILTDDGMPPDKAWELALACQQSGRDAEGFARHTVRLRRALREARP